MTTSSDGYCRFKLFNVIYRAHRVCWALHYGQWPQKEIDHKNCNPIDNRIINLREATSSQNNGNQRKLTPKTSHLKGAFFNKKEKVWKSRIIHEGVTYELGSFATDTEAHQAYCLKGAELRKQFFRA